jgi:hypothetical protein
MLFQFTKHRSKSLVPHLQFTKQNNNLKRVSPHARQIYVPMFNAAGGGNTPCVDEGYYHGQPCGGIGASIFAEVAKEKEFHQTKNRKNY